MANDFLITIDDFTVPSSPDPLRCRVFAFLRDISGIPLRNLQVHFLNTFIPQIATDVSADIGILGERVIVTTDDDGFFQIDLFRNSEVRVLVASQTLNPHETDATPFFTVFVPDANSVNFVDLLYPVPDTFDFLTGVGSPVVIAVDATLKVDVEMKDTLGNIIENFDLIEVVSSDVTLVAVRASVDADQPKVTMERLAAGQVFITAKRREDEIPIKHQPAKTITFLIDGIADANGLQVD